MAIDLEQAYTRYGPMVLRRCRAILRSSSLAEDALQDVFVQLARRKDAIEAQSLASLLFQIATYVSLNQLRSMKRHPEHSGDALLQEIASLGDEDGNRGFHNALLDTIFQREPVSTRVIATLHFIDGMTLEEVAAEVGLSVSGVRKRMRVLREKVSLLGAMDDVKTA